MCETEKSALTTEAPENGCASQPQPHEVFMLFSRTLPMIHREYIFQPDAQSDAEMIARANRGHQISILRVVATVSEPLPDLQWSDGRPAGDGQDRGITHGLGGRVPSSNYDQVAKQVADRNSRY